MRQLNLGAGGQNLPDFVNLDLDIAEGPDVVGDGTALPFADGSLDYVYASHVLEHLRRPDGLDLLRECYRVLAPGRGVCVAVPDMRAILTGYVTGTNPGPGPHGDETIDHTDLDVVSHLYIYSTIQSSPHLWSYDIDTLVRAVGVAGFEWVRDIEPRQWWECAVFAVKDDGSHPGEGFHRIALASAYGR